MDTTTTTSPALPTDIEQRIADYRPTAIQRIDWDACRSSVTTLVRACPPADPADARDLLTSAVHFLKTMHPASGSWDLPAVLTETNLERFKQRWLQAGDPVHTLRNHLARLNRLARAARGESGARQSRPRTGTRRDGTRIYSQDELAAFHQAAQRAPSDVGERLARLLALAGRGVVIPEELTCDADREAWQDARTWVAEQGLPALDGRKLRRTWALQVASRASLLETVRAGVTRGELEGLLPHLADRDRDTDRR